MTTKTPNQTGKFHELSDTGALVTDPKDLGFWPASDMLILRSGARITHFPLFDRKHNLAARVGHGPAATWLQSQGMRLPTVAEYQELHEASLRAGNYVEPYTLPGDSLELLTEYGYPQNQEGLKTFLVRHMRSHRMCQIHDTEVLRRLDVLRGGLPNGGPVCNFGKHWATNQTIVGWWRPDGSMIQNPSRFHAGDPTYTDYATTFHGVVPSPTANDPLHRDIVQISRVLKLGSSGDDVRWWQEQIGTKADGHFGLETEAITKSWQAAHGLASDGVVGQRSVEAAGGVWDPVRGG